MSQIRKAISTIEKPKPFDAYEVHGCAKFHSPKGDYAEQVDDSQAQFWTLFGHVTGEGLHEVGDFRSRSAAEEVMQRIIGYRDEEYRYEHTRSTVY
jgi:hypothetical protein